MAASCYSTADLSSFAVYLGDSCAGILTVGNTVFHDLCLLEAIRINLEVDVPEDITDYCPTGIRRVINGCPEYTAGTIEVDLNQVNTLFLEALGTRQPLLSGAAHVASKLDVISCVPTFVEIGFLVLPEACPAGPIVPQCVYELYQVTGWHEVSVDDINFDGDRRERRSSIHGGSAAKSKVRGAMSRISPQAFRNMTTPNQPAGELTHWRTSWPGGANAWQMRTDPIPCVSRLQTTCGPRTFV